MTRKNNVTHRPPGEQAQAPHGRPDLCLALAETLTARLCHDLAGGVGTLIGALEMAAEEPDMQAEALPIAREAGIRLGQQLRLMRAAWGDGGEEIDVAGLRTLAAGLPVGRRVKVEMSAISPDRHFSQQASRLLLNLLMVGVESLAGDGTLRVSEAPGGDVVITISGPRAAWPPGFASQISDADTALAAAANSQPRQLLAPLTALIAHACNMRLTMLLGAHAQAAPPLVATLG